MHERPRLGTRGSPLAMAQATMVAGALEAAHGWAAGTVEIVPITTTGDKVQDRPLADIGGKALWTKELDRCLLDKRTDFSVHSLKDVESVRPDAIRIAAVLERADPRDRIIGVTAVDELSPGAVVGTSSPRRRAQLLAMRPDLTIVPLRGNVGTRLGKLESGEMAAIVLAAAGLDRLGRQDIGSPVTVEQMLPAPTQAIVAIECRSDDAATAEMLALIDHAETRAASRVERAFTSALGGSCHSPIAALAVVEESGLRMRMQILAEDGSLAVSQDERFAADDDEAPRRLAHAMLDRAPEAIRRLFQAA